MRGVTQTGRLTLADARALVSLLGTADRIDPVIGDRVYRTKSSHELSRLNLLFEWAKAAGLARAVGGKLVPVKKNAEHEIVIEAVVPAEPGVVYPRCVDGVAACPPEDCGGPWGYRDLRETLADPGSADHHELLDWLGIENAGEFDPAAFDVDAANRRIASDWIARGTRGRG